MQTLVVANNKGGVGKSLITVQFAHYLNHKGLRVLVLDFDHQLNTTKALTLSGLPVVSEQTTTRLFVSGADGIEDGAFVVVPGTRDLLKLEKQGVSTHNTYLANMQRFLSAVDEQFDVCLIDTNGNPDVRVMAALVLSGYVLSPIELNQEAVDGIGDLLSDVRNVKAKLNPSLELVGILPNMVEPTPFQRSNFEHIASSYSKLLIPVKAGSKEFAHIKNRSAFPEAQAMGVPIWAIKKTAARDAWRELEPYFHIIAKRIGLEISE